MMSATLARKTAPSGKMRLAEQRMAPWFITWFIINGIWKSQMRVFRYGACRPSPLLAASSRAGLDRFYPGQPKQEPARHQRATEPALPVSTNVGSHYDS